MACRSPRCSVCSISGDSGRAMRSIRSDKKMILSDIFQGVGTSVQKSGSRLTRLLNNKEIKPLIYKDKSQGHFSPKKRRYQGKLISGFNAEMLIDICEGMLEARLNNHRLKHGGFKLTTESRDTRRLNDVS